VQTRSASETPNTPDVEIVPTESDTAEPEPTATPEATSPSDESDGARIAFVSDRDGSRDIYVMNADGSEQINLTQHDADDNGPTMSPDGNWVAFVSNRDDPNPAICQLDLSCNWEIYVLNTADRTLNRLTDTPGQEMFPAWSPDGTQIAFMSEFDIFAMNVDGSNQTNLTGDGAGNLYPVWMPDPSRIIFLSLRDGGFQFYSMAADGSDQTMLDSGLPPSELSPGSFGIYLLENGEVYIGSGGSLETIQDTDLAIGEYPTWSPDGTQIAFHSRRDGNMEIYVMEADGSAISRLTENDASDMFPTWSPDGTHLAFSSDRDGNWEIYVMDADGSGVTNLTNNPADDTTPAWYP
jgi:Tol biopolymer transport system component